MRSTPITIQIWEMNFGALKKFKAREGHCQVPSLHIESGLKLGQWVRQQRRLEATKTLLSERAVRLKKIGLLLDPFESKWESGIAALANYKAREGHCDVPKGHVEGVFRLGTWIANRRGKWKSLSAGRRGQLKALGLTISVHEKAWERHFLAMLRFKRREGHCLVPRLHLEGGFKLGVWVHNQRSTKNVLRADRRRRLNAVGFIWVVNKAVY